MEELASELWLMQDRALYLPSRSKEEGKRYQARKTDSYAESRHKTSNEIRWAPLLKQRCCFHDRRLNRKLRIAGKDQLDEPKSCLEHNGFTQPVVRKPKRCEQSRGWRGIESSLEH